MDNQIEPKNDTEKAVTEEDEYIVDIQFTGPVLPLMFDALRSVKTEGTIFFTPHEITVLGTETQGRENRLLSILCFKLTRHQADRYKVTETKFQRNIILRGIQEILSAKIYRNKADEKSTLVFQIKKSDPNMLILTQKMASSGGPTVHEIKLLAQKNHIEYDNDYNRNSSRTISSEELKQKSQALVTWNHHFASIKMTANKIVFTGEGDGRQYSQSNKCESCIEISNPPLDDPEAMAYEACDIFDVLKLKTFTRLSSLSPMVHLYLESEKPLLLEYIVPYENTSAKSQITPKGRKKKNAAYDAEEVETFVPQEAKDCPICIEDVQSSGQGYVRYILGPHRNNV